MIQRPALVLKDLDEKWERVERLWIALEEEDRAAEMYNHHRRYRNVFSYLHRKDAEFWRVSAEFWLNSLGLKNPYLPEED